MASITAQQVREAQQNQVQEVVTALLVVHNAVAGMKGSKLGDFDLWLGGLPSDISGAGGQAYFQAQQLAQKFGLPEIPPQSEN